VRVYRCNFADNLELENCVKLVDPTKDALYDFNKKEWTALTEARPWKGKPNYFQHVRISAVALLKMVTHARSGKSLEVMGLMQGKVIGDTFVVLDAFRLPVEGTETRVNAHDDANTYMIEYLATSRELGQEENVIGWYHSHPGYGCWLSGIDVATQALQQYTDPQVAVVIDPDRTISAGKVEIGAFRTYPEDYTPPNAADDGFQTIPLNKIEDFGAHSSRYYPLEVSTFKSTLDSHLLDQLWNKYWVATLSQSPLFANRDYASKQMTDLSLKIRRVEQSGAIANRSKVANTAGDKQMDKIVKEGGRIASEEIRGIMASMVKNQVFRLEE
jgi:COP9 signalosome complex subunit 5